MEITNKNILEDIKITNNNKPSDFTQPQFENILFNVVDDCGFHLDDINFSDLNKLYKMKSLKEVANILNDNNDDLLKPIDFNITIPCFVHWFEQVVNDSIISTINGLPIKDFVNLHFKKITTEMSKYYKEFWAYNSNVVGDTFHKLTEEVA
jgi:hypothetical protein